MILLYLLFCLYFVSYDGLSYKISTLYFIIWALLGIACVAHVILLTYTVYSDAKEKKLASKGIWALLTIIFDIPCVVVYVLFTFRAEKSINKKIRKRNIFLNVLSLLLIIVFFYGSQITDKYYDDYTHKHFDNSVATYKNEKNQDVIYDKMGNSYTFLQSRNMTYYDRNGNKYTPIIHDDIRNINGFKCSQNNKEYLSDDYEFLIDRDGYIVILPYDSINYSDLGVCYDNSGNIYYDIIDCYWTPDGKLKFYSDYNNDYEKITYEQILSYEQQMKKEDAIIKVERFFSDFEDSDWDSIKYCCSADFIKCYFDNNTLFGFKSAELIKITEQGYIDGNENKYYSKVKIKGRPEKNSEFYNSENKVITASLTVTLEYVTDDEYYKEWIVTDIKSNNE